MPSDPFRYMFEQSYTEPVNPLAYMQDLPTERNG